MAKIANNYFPHDFNARYDRKILRLRKVLGIEGYGIFWMLVETLCTEENFSYPLNEIDLLADDYGCSTEKVVAVVKQFDLFQIDKAGCFFSLSLITRLQKYLDMSENARKAVNKRWEKARKLKEMDTTVLPPYYEGNTIREENIIEQDIKEYEIREDEDIYTPIFNHWNSFAKENGLTEIQTLNDTRKKHIRARLKEKFFDFQLILKKITESDFLKGENDKKWEVTFDWIFEGKKNYTKILENNYMNRGNDNGKEKSHGVTAAELARIFPECVPNRNSDGLDL